jgi:hypothetical protein
VSIAFSCAPEDRRGRFWEKNRGKCLSGGQIASGLGGVSPEASAARRRAGF